MEEESQTTEEIDDEVDLMEDLVFTKLNSKFMENKIPIFFIPKGTILFRGVPSDIADDSFGNVGNIGWFADLKTAGHYAFRQDKVIGQPIMQGEGGKIISYEVKKNLKLFDLANCRSEHHLRRIINDGTIANLLTLIYNCEGDMPRRNSFAGADHKVAKWICENTKLDGWAYDVHIGFHPEVMLCMPEKSLERIDFEYHFDEESGKVFVFKDEDMVSVKEPSHVGGVIFDRRKRKKLYFS